MLTADALELEAKLFRGFADTSRLAILTALARGRRNVGQLVEETGLSQPNASNHLACLRECGLVRAEQEGRFVFYELAHPQVAQTLRLARTIVADVAQTMYDCTRYDEKPRKRDA